MKIVQMLLALILATANCCAQDWPALWKNYAARFMDDQIRVIDHDAGDRTTSEGQAYAMFFALVANDRSRFDGLLRWTEKNLAAGDLSGRLPAWLWGKAQDGTWRVLDENSASDADVWIAYTLLEAGKAWKEPRYTSLGTALAKEIEEKEVVQIPGLGASLLPGAKGFRKNDAYRLNASYLPLQVLTRLGHELPDGPWQQIASQLPAVVRGSSPAGFVSDWVEFSPGKGFTASSPGSYDAIRVYLWAGMLDPGTPGRDALLKNLSGMATYLRTNAVPPSKVKPDGTIDGAKSSAGFSASLVPYLSALGETKSEQEQLSRLQAALNSTTGLYGNPATYYDQNLALFALGWKTRRFWFDAQGNLNTAWKSGG